MQKGKGAVEVRNAAALERKDLSERVTAMTKVSPPWSAANLIERSVGGQGAELDLSAALRTMEILTDKVNAVQAGDMSGMKEMLVSQAHSLDSLFLTLTSNALKGGRLERQEKLLKLALRVQSQCRATIETLNNVLHPRLFVNAKQANVATNQQINNSSREAENEKAPNELLDAGSSAATE